MYYMLYIIQLSNGRMESLYTQYFQNFYLLLTEFEFNLLNKRPTGLNGHLSIRDFTLTSCQKGSYLYINVPIIE